MREMKNIYTVLVGIPKWKGPLERPRHRWEDNIRMDVREMWWEDVDWIHVDQDREQWRAFVNMVMNPRVPYKVGNFLTS
jgi:hypothetical protein